MIINLSREIRTQRLIDQLIKRLQEDNQKLKTLDERKTEFVSLASHQLRSPLSIIQGYTSMIHEGDYGKVPKQMQEPVNRILSSSIALGFLINDYLNVSKIEKGEMEYTIKDVSLNKLMDGIIRELMPLSKKGDVNLDFKPLKNNLVIRGDENKIREVISNVIDNAFKYTESGSIKVRYKKEDKNFALITIEDTGIGVDGQDIDSIFKKFERSKNAIYMNVSGTGLGLFVAKIIVEAHGGKIWVESDGLGKGSIFKMKFRLAKK